MESNDIFLAMGKFEAKINALEKTVDRLEICIERLTVAMGDNKGGWQLLFALAAVSSVLGAAVHKPIEMILSVFR